MSQIETYRGLQVLSATPTGDGGLAINENFKRLAELTTEIAARDPVATDDRDAKFTVGSEWFNTSTGAEWICVDDTPAAAVWQSKTADVLVADQVTVSGTTTALTAASGSYSVLTIDPVYNQFASISANTDLLINRTETAVGSGAQLLIDAQVGGVSQFTVSNTGTVTATAFVGDGSGLTNLPGGGGGASAPLTLTGTSDTVQLTVKGHSTQTANLQNWENSLGVDYALINKEGTLHVGKHKGVGDNDIDILRFGNDDGAWFSETPFRMGWSNADLGSNTVFFDDGSGSYLNLRVGILSAINLSLSSTAAMKGATFSPTSTAISGTTSAVSITPTYNQLSGTASNTDLLINRTETAIGSGYQRLIDAQVNAVSMFIVENTGSTRLQNNTWHYDMDGNGRLYYQASGTSYFKSPMTGALDINYAWRNGADATLATLNGAGKLYIAGALDCLGITSYSTITVNVMASHGTAFSVFNTDYGANRFTVDDTGVVTASARITSGVVALTDGATINTNASLGNTFTVTLAGSRAMAAPTNPTAGQKIMYQIKQDGTGSRTITWNAAFRFSGGTAPTLTTTAAKTDYIGFVYNDVDDVWDNVGSSLNF